ncbi:hypothetical protein QE152_g37540 [Popillia japonica]|uniref:Fibronectin type-III domain-containing protein n=1 Tax=Popillia japonica TaxID=7064 RepID=A0AAW1I9B3_POPJA
MSTLGQNSTYYREQKISVAPPNQQITDILFEEINRSLHLTWDKPENLTGCEVAYYVSYSTTLVQMTGYTQSTGYTIDFNNFCFHVFVEIEVLVDGEYNSITSDEYHTTPNVDNFRIDQINDTNIVLKWDPHPRGERCFLRYKVVRIINGEESELSVATVNPPLYLLTLRNAIV